MQTQQAPATRWLYSWRFNLVMAVSMAVPLLIASITTEASGTALDMARIVGTRIVIFALTLRFAFLSGSYFERSHAASSKPS